MDNGVTHTSAVFQELVEKNDTMADDWVTGDYFFKLTRDHNNIIGELSVDGGLNFLEALNTTFSQDFGDLQAFIIDSTVISPAGSFLELAQINIETRAALPEPGSISLFGLGLIGLAGIARNKNEEINSTQPGREGAAMALTSSTPLKSLLEGGF